MRRRGSLDESELGRIDQKERVESRLSEDCFRKVEFLGTAHQEMYKGVSALRSDVDPAFHYSVYGAFVQTSGTGKTRAVMEMSKLGVYICYCSLAGKFSSAYPPRTGALADKLATTVSELGMVLYLKAWLLVLDDAIVKGVTPEQWKEMQLPVLDGQEVDLAEVVLDKWDRLLATEGDGMETDDADPDEVNLSFLREILETLEGRLACSNMPCIVFVLDEARGLHQVESGPLSQSPFYQIRRALRVFFNYEAFFALMLDTAAKMSNLLPKRSDEDSSRALKVGIGLLHPLYFLPNMMLHKPRPGLSFSDYTKPVNWVRYGRPLWAARLDREGDPRKVLQLARLKLVGGVLKGNFQGTDVDLNQGIMTESQALALLSAPAGFEICARSMVPEVMVASHMNLLLRVTQDRSRIYVCLPAEPVLAEAAAVILKKDIVKETALMHMEAACRAGYVTPGPRGEFVAKFILVAAIWSLKENQSRFWYLRPIPVEAFLEKLLVNRTGDRSTFHKLRAKIPDGGVVFFNSFLAVRRPPDVALLGRCFAGGHAIMYKAENNLPGADLIIPVYTPKGMTAIVDSVKNTRQAGWLEKVSVDKVKCDFTEVEVAPGLPVITIVMSLQEPKMVESTNWLLWDDVNAPAGDLHIHLTCYGIEHNYSFLSKNVKKLLREVLVTVPDPLAGATDEEKSWIHQMIPEEFETPDPTYAYF